MIIFLAILFTLTFYFFNKRKYKKHTLQTKTAITAKKEIKRAYQLAKKKNPDLFKNLLLQSLSLYFSKKFKIKQSDFTKEKLEDVLIKNKISIDIIKHALNIIHNLELYNYSGRDELKINEGIFKDSIEIIDLIERNKK